MMTVNEKKMLEAQFLEVQNRYGTLPRLERGPRGFVDYVERVDECFRSMIRLQASMMHLLVDKL